MNNLKGYTLVEVLIVMTLFSVISLLSLSFLNTSVSSSIGISSKSKLLNELSLLSELLKDDLFHVAKQYPRADELNQFPTFFKLDNDFREGEPILELVRNSASDGIEDQGAINKIHYKVKDNVLYRNYSSYLNSAYQERPFALVSEIEDIEIKALYDKNEYLIWPPFNEADIEIYPTLLEVNIIFNEGNFKKIFFISGDDVVG
jgi:type II secretion system protein J|tara:strand:+ start:1003 stop:1611 length:609 start_codon:yes stop_codon:yes gene_type:complete